MKTLTALLRPAIVSTAFALAFAVLPAASAMESSTDSATQTLARAGSIRVERAGPFVAPGTYRVQVSAKLGRPDVTLPDGTWLYHHRRVEGSEAAGTLVVGFNSGRVSSLALVTPAVALAMTATPSKAEREFVARK